MEKIPILDVQINRTNYSNCTKEILTRWIDTKSHMVCIANVHMLMEAFDSPDFKKIINSADLVTPDGMPLVWMLRMKGAKKQGRVYGPTLMLHILEAASREKIPVGFYGSTPEVLDLLGQKMKSRFPSLNLVYSYSPPFRELSKEEDDEVCQQILASGVKILFVGLGCPKQEIWMAEHRGKINTVMVGVGAAFDFHAGSKPQAPSWMQAVGLEWLFRFIHEPKRLAKRYLINNPRFIVLAFADLLGLLGDGESKG